MNENPSLRLRQHDVEQAMSRRRFIGGSLVALAALATGCKKEVDKTLQSHMPSTPPSQSVVPQKEQTVEVPEEFKLMPKVVFTSKEADFQVPSGFDMNQDDFRKASQELGKQMGQMVPVKVQQLHEAIDPQQREAVMIHFVTDIAGAAASIHPQLKKYLDEKFGVGTVNFVEVAQWLNPLLMPGGYYLQANIGAKLDSSTQGVKPDPHLAVYKILKSEVIELVDLQGVEPVNLYSLSRPLFETGSGHEVGFYDAQIGAGFVLSEGLEAHAKDLLRQTVKGTGFEQKLDADQIGKAYARDTSVHEATHPVIGKKFPKYGKWQALNVGLNVPVIEQVDDMQIPFNDSYHPMNFQEMCAVGNELFHSDSPSPLSLMRYLTVDEGPASGYLLISRILPIVVLRFAPDSDLRREIIMRLKPSPDESSQGHEAKLSRVDFVRLVLETYKLEDVKKVGAYLYSRGKYVLERFEQEAGQ